MTDARGEVAGDNDLAAAYGEDYGSDNGFDEVRPKRTEFAPWHHPVKQRVRTSQWQCLVQRLIGDRALNGQVLRYFTLPGPDLLDVRVLAETCGPQDVIIEYFGFDAAMRTAQINTPRFEIESALRQAQRITDDAVTSPDQLQDIAIPNSQASKQLSMRRPFDVINIDACDHLAFSPPSRQTTTFDALQTLLAHQMNATETWLLFITTRAEPAHMVGPGEQMRRAVNDNLNHQNGEFRPILAELVGEDPEVLDRILHQIWTSTDDRFLKLYSVGLAKFLLQFFLAQPNRPANVELASSCAYRVFGDSPDMLALAFRITPAPHVVFQPGQVPEPNTHLELERAIRVAQRARKLRDLDRELEQNHALRLQMARESASLLGASNYDIDRYCTWLAEHKERPITIERELLN